ncbi:MAG: hypothetical protein HC769_11710 [Cyanobacteria bacterium CRU_2_1]|nr:hypothetical protein [Cyanobacteria bacterium CRU_2_1]
MFIATNLAWMVSSDVYAQETELPVGTPTETVDTPNSPIDNFWSWVANPDEIAPGTEYRVVKDEQGNIIAVFSHLVVVPDSGVLPRGRQPRRLVVLWSQDSIRAYTYRPECDPSGFSIGVDFGQVQVGQDSTAIGGSDVVNSSTTRCRVSEVRSLESLEIEMGRRQIFTLNRTGNSNPNTLPTSSSPLALALQVFGFSDSSFYSDDTREELADVRADVGEPEIFEVFPVDEELAMAFSEFSPGVLLQPGQQVSDVPVLVLRLPNRSTASIDLYNVAWLRQLYQESQ